MARTVEQIEQDMAALEAAIATLGQEFEQIYRSYLAELGTTARQQLIMATYHLCTQGYPEAFLSLAVSQREALQRSLRQVAQTSQARLEAALDEVKAEAEAAGTEAESAEEMAGGVAGLILSQDEAEELQSALQENFGAMSKAIANRTFSFDSTSFDSTSFDADDEEQSDFADDFEFEDDFESDRDALLPDFEDSLEDDESARVFSESDAAQNASTFLLEAATAALSDAANVSRSTTASHPLTPPEVLARWQAKLERRIAAILRDQSQAANRLLHQADILPSKIPEPILEVAAKTSIAESTASPPNLLNLVIEARGEASDEVSVTRIMAIRLRLGELEFGSPLLANWRSKVRGLNARLKQIGKDYEKKTRERAIAQAEQAWRATWFED
ncbi:MAG: hypothetical protein Fur0046_02760 [Cyanobacteria bacterium J069]|nr:MAG: hypothetical protein D6742_12475 [Cyanobacteria bacterium J069]